MTINDTAMFYCTLVGSWTNNEIHAVPVEPHVARQRACARIIGLRAGCRRGSLESSIVALRSAKETATAFISVRRS